MNQTRITSTATVGGAGGHPSVTRHLQQQAPVQAPQQPSLPVTPAQAAIGGAGCHPAVAKHLQGR